MRIPTPRTHYCSQVVGDTAAPVLLQLAETLDADVHCRIIVQLPWRWKNSADLWLRRYGASSLLPGMVVMP